MSKYALMVAMNGARRSRADHPALPVTEEQIAAAAADCFRAGADTLHLHVRDEQGRHSLDAGRYRGAMAAVAEVVPDMAIQITTESAGLFGPEEQFSCLEHMRPAAASVSVREMARDPQIAARAYALCAEAGTRVQHILYGPQCWEQLAAWYGDATVPGDMRDAIFVLGKYAPQTDAIPEEVATLLPVAARLDLNWSLCAFGAQEHSCLLAAIAAGGDVRVGFENSLSAPTGPIWTDNAASVSALVAAASAAGHQSKRG